MIFLKMLFQYLKYLVRHKYWVYVAGRKLGVAPYILLLHDLSKFLPSEFLAYCRFFYGEYPKQEELSPAIKYQFNHRTAEDVEAAFNLAWLKHQHRNPHHWQHWILREDDGGTLTLDMPNRYVAEMVADWAGAGKAISGKWDLAEWYLKTEDTRLLSPLTKVRTELAIIKLLNALTKEMGQALKKETRKA